MISHVSTAVPVMGETMGRTLRDLHGPWLDMLLLGGASVIAYVLIVLLDPTTTQTVVLGGVMMVLANFVNHPHFAHSYQIFYGSWRDVRSCEMPSSLRARWYLAGVVLPATLAVWLAVAGWRWMEGDTWLMGVSLNLMGALVGWHYVKQGFGMAMMDAALKKKFWTPAARQALLWNAYACWLAAWVLINSSRGGQAYWGIFGIGLTVPPVIVIAACLVVVLTTLWAALAALRSLGRWPLRQHRWHELPISGLAAYFVTLYLWTVFSWVNPAYMLVIPFFHSVQYLAVVWRYKQNEILAHNNLAGKSMARFWAIGFLLGALGFWLVPVAIDFAHSGYLPNVSNPGQPALAIGAFWIFINVHHYLIDNVLWRQGNPKVNQYLFNAGLKG